MKFSLNQILLQNNTIIEHSSGQKLFVYDRLPSTNDYLKMMVSNITPLEEFTAIMTKHQTQGRGQRQNTFISPDGESLTFSFILYPNNLKPSDNFSISMMISLAVSDWLSELGLVSEIKWPNDIMCNGKKLGGILIENTFRGQLIKHSIVGIGINIRQKLFPDELAKKATSMALQNERFNDIEITEACISLMKHVKIRHKEHFETFPETKDDLILAYNKRLFGLNVEDNFFLIKQQQRITGKIVGANEQGQLLVYSGGIKHAYNLHEISFGYR